MSVKSCGVDVPAMHQTMSRAWSLFHAVAAAMSGAAYEGEDTSAEM
jgi:hypothetical protein